jgi:hypothetical protein
MGDDFMRKHMIPRPDGPPERAVMRVALSYQRASVA